MQGCGSRDTVAGPRRTASRFEAARKRALSERAVAAGARPN